MALPFSYGTEFRELQEQVPTTTVIARSPNGATWQSPVGWFLLLSIQEIATAFGLAMTEEDCAGFENKNVKYS